MHSAPPHTGLRFLFSRFEKGDRHDEEDDLRLDCRHERYPARKWPHPRGPVPILGRLRRKNWETSQANLSLTLFSHQHALQMGKGGWCLSGASPLHAARGPHRAWECSASQRETGELKAGGRAAAEVPAWASHRPQGGQRWGGLARSGRRGGQDLSELRVLLAAACASPWVAHRQNPGHPFGKDVSAPESRGEVKREQDPLQAGKGRAHVRLELKGQNLR